jgi:hypothetical protein
MCQMTSTGFLGEGSPDACDAAVWALSDLMVVAHAPFIARAITGTAWNGPRFFGLRIDKRTTVSPEAAGAPLGPPNGRHLARDSGTRPRPGTAVVKNVKPDK